MLVQLRGRVANIERRKGKPVTEADVALKLEGDADVYKPDGEPLLILRRGVIDKATCEMAYPALHKLRLYGSQNRSTYSGVKVGKRRYADGTLSRQNVAIKDGKTVSVKSAVVGYFDRQGGRFPFCRETAFVGAELAQWKTVLPMVDVVADCFKATAPVRYAKQLAMAKKTPKDFVIGATPFTTLTVNNNVVGAIHQDKGDYKDGLGVISVVRRGSYQGAWLVFPEYQVGCDLRDGDVLFFNSHDWHGVTPFHDFEEGYERISVVYYFRSRMVDCLSAKDEVTRAKARGALT